jgi:hypothetical protein
VTSSWVAWRKKGLVAEKQIIDPDNPVHQKFRDMAVRNDDTSTPIIYIEDVTGNLKYIGAGVAFIHVLRLAAIEKDLQEARQKELVDAYRYPLGGLPPSPTFRVTGGKPHTKKICHCIFAVAY